VSFGPDTAELEADLAEIERCLQVLDVDSGLSPQARNLRRTYYTHRRDKLWPHLVRLTHQRKVQSCEQELQRRRAALGRLSGNATPDEIQEAANGCEQAENVLGEARAELDAKSSALVDVPDESWEAITPRELLLAVAHVRSDFERLADGICFSTEKRCFRELHPTTAGNAEPAVFRRHFEDCVRKLCAVVDGVFSRVVEISLAQKGTIGQVPIEWAALQVRDLIDHKSRRINHWVKSACDKPDYDIKSLHLKTAEELLFRTDWRAPKWLLMKPNGNAPYDPSTVWDRMNEAETCGMLKALREDRWVLSLETTLEQLVGSAHERLAKRGTHAAPRSRKQATEPLPQHAGKRDRSGRQAVATEYRAVEQQQGGPITPSVAAPLSRHRQRSLDMRKELIARLKARNPGTKARKICELIDQTINKEAPIRQGNLAPLESWRKLAPDERTWVGFYDHPKTHNQVRTYVNKVPPLKTAKSQK
jgi:hypothetical protein